MVGTIANRRGHPPQRGHSSSPRPRPQALGDPPLPVLWLQLSPWSQKSTEGHMHLEPLSALLDHILGSGDPTIPCPFSEAQMTLRTKQ